MQAKIDVAEERARERIRIWFAERDRPFVISKRPRHGIAWMLLITVLFTGTLLGNHAPVIQALSSIHSVFGV